MTNPSFQTLSNGAHIAYERLAGRTPTFVWLGGFKSDMTGTKAEALAEWARKRGQGFVRFDYSGHGRSSGRFIDGTIGSWLSDTLAMIDRVTAGPLCLVGSSMGAWLALLATQARPDRVKALLLIAPAVDFTERLLLPALKEDARRQLAETGQASLQSGYEPEPYPITNGLIEDGRRRLLLDAPIPISGPVRILQGGSDCDVPVAHARLVADRIGSPDLAFELIEDGDHRLSRPQDLALLIAAAESLAG